MRLADLAYEVRSGSLSAISLINFAMDRLPPELVSEIASLLSLDALRQLRLVNRYLASSVYPVLYGNISVVNTAEHVEELMGFLKQCPAAAQFTRHLTIYHAAWPVCNRTVWERHPLLFGGKEIGVGYRMSAVADAAFQSYTDFIAREALRDFSDLASLIFMFQNLQTVTISHIRCIPRMKNSQCRRLIRRIWLGPRVKDSAVMTVTPFLRLFHDFPNITNFTKLNIDSQLVRVCIQ